MSGVNKQFCEGEEEGLTFECYREMDHNYVPLYPYPMLYC